MALSDRQEALLRALAAQSRPVSAGRAATIAFPDRPIWKRQEAGAAATLDALARRSLVDFQYRVATGAREWWITSLGRQILDQDGGRT